MIPTALRRRDSEKTEKRLLNRRLRRRADQALYHGDETFALPREISNIWGWPKDGHIRFFDVTEAEWPRLARFMRK